VELHESPLFQVHLIPFFHASDLQVKQEITFG
jgi:hypothetical protein